MPKRIPTQAGDVLVMRTAKSYTINMVGRILNDGQQDFQNQSDLKFEKDRGAALSIAKSLRSPGRRIFLVDVDTNISSEISDANKLIELDTQASQTPPPRRRAHQSA